MNFEIEEATGLMLRLMQKKEPLRSDLWAYLDHNAPASDLKNCSNKAIGGYRLLATSFTFFGESESTTSERE